MKVVSDQGARKTSVCSVVNRLIKVNWAISLEMRCGQDSHRGVPRHGRGSSMTLDVRSRHSASLHDTLRCIASSALLAGDFALGLGPTERVLKQLLNGPALLDHHKGLDDISLLNIIEFRDFDTAFKTFFDFLCVVLEPA